MLMMTDDKTQYLTVEEIATELRISDDLVFKWLNRKELIGYKLARNVWRIKRDDLDTFLETRLKENLEGKG